MPNLDLGNLVVHLRLDDGAFRLGMGAVRGSLNAIKGGLGQVERVLRRASQAALAYGAVSVKAFASFEKQLASVSTMLDEQTMRYLPGYERALKAMAIEFGEGTETLSKGLYDILSASIPASKAINVLRTSVVAATAGMTTTAKAADAITTILNAYALSADQAEYVSDILFATVKRGKITFDELASGIGRAASISAVAGLSLEEVGAAIATMTRSGLRAEIAMTALRAIVTSFMRPTEDAAAAAEALGLHLNTATLRAMGLTGVLQRLRTASAEQVAALMPNVRGLTGIASALKQVEANADDLQFMYESLGRTQEAYGKMAGTLSFAISRLWQSLKITAVGVGERLAPVMRAIADFFVENQRTIESWAVALADRVVFVGQVLMDLVRLLRTNFRAGMEGAFTLLLNMFEAAARLAIDLAVRTGKGIWKGIREGIFGSTERQIEEKALQWYKSGGHPMKKVPGFGYVYGFGGGYMDTTREVPADEELMERYRKKAREVIEKPFFEDVLEGFPEKVRQVFRDLQKDVSTGSEQVGQIIERRLSELRFKDAARKARDAWEGVKEGLEPVLGVLGKVKDATLAYFGAQKAAEPMQRLAAEDMEAFDEALTQGRGKVALMIRELQHEYRWLGMISEERERGVRLAQFELAVQEELAGQPLEAARALQRYNELLERISEGKTGPAAMTTALKRWAYDAGNIWRNLGDAVASAFDRMSRSLTDMVMTGKAQFRDFARAVVADILQIMIRWQMVAGLQAVFPAMFAARPSYAPQVTIGEAWLAEPLPVHHSGKAAGWHPAFPRLQVDEYPAVIKRGETILPEGAGVVPPTVVINNNTGLPLDQAGPPRFDGDQWVVNVVVRDLNERGPIRKAMEAM